MGADYLAASLPTSSLLEPETSPGCCSQRRKVIPSGRTILKRMAVTALPSACGPLDCGPVADGDDLGSLREKTFAQPLRPDWPPSAKPMRRTGTRRLPWQGLTRTKPLVWWTTTP